MAKNFIEKSSNKKVWLQAFKSAIPVGAVLSFLMIADNINLRAKKGQQTFFDFANKNKLGITLCYLTSGAITVGLWKLKDLLIKKYDNNPNQSNN